jgi:lactate racemase
MIRSLAPGGPIAKPALEAFLDEAFEGVAQAGAHLLVVVPDDTRTLPMREIFAALIRCVAPRVGRVTVLVALGTHPAMTRAELDAHLGPGWEASEIAVRQHEWQNSDALVELGRLPAAVTEELSGGRLAEPVTVRIHRLALDADRILIVNPVFPHEVVGFSGGHKYFFPGIAGPEILDATHWLGALITNPKVNGHRDTPVRALIERAADLVPTPRSGLSLVMQGHEAVGLFAGPVREAWAAAVDLSARTNIVWAERSYDRILSAAPPMYRELWTAGKCMYKLEPVLADGGELIIYAPHIHTISPTHGEWILRVGYHTRDYFLSKMGRFADVPRAVLAHATHVKGIGRYENGIERPRARVVLATGIPEAVCERINLGYRDPATIDPAEFTGREAEGVLFVPDAGEQLYRLADGTVPDVDRL